MSRLTAVFLAVALLSGACGGDNRATPSELAVPRITTTTVYLPDSIVIGDVLLDANDIFAAREVVEDNSVAAEAEAAAASTTTAPPATTSTSRPAPSPTTDAQPTVPPTSTLDEGVMALAEAVAIKMVNDLGITDPGITACLMGSLADAITLISQAQTVTSDDTERLTFLAVDDCNAGPSIFASSIGDLGLPAEIEKCMIDNLDGEAFEDVLASDDSASSTALITGLIERCVQLSS